MCAGGDLMEKTLTEASQLLQKLSKAVAMQRDWETRLSGKPECDTSVRPLAGIFRNKVPEEKKEEPIPKKVEEIKHAEARTIPESGHAETSKASERTMSSAKPLREFEQMDWVPIDFEKSLTREDCSLIKRGWRKPWRWTSAGETCGTTIQPRDNRGGPSKTL
jgi:hypothetical protein